MLSFSGLNVWAVIAAVFVNVIIGAWWYSPAGLGKLWSKFTGLDMHDMKKSDANRGIAFVFVGAIVQAYVLAVLVKSLNITTEGTALVLALILWVGFISSSTIGDAVYARRGWKLWALNGKFFLIVFLINCSILALWR